MIKKRSHAKSSPNLSRVKVVQISVSHQISCIINHQMHFTPGSTYTVADIGVLNPTPHNSLTIRLRLSTSAVKKT